MIPQMIVYPTDDLVTTVPLVYLNAQDFASPIGGPKISEVTFILQMNSNGTYRYEDTNLLTLTESGPFHTTFNWHRHPATGVGANYEYQITRVIISDPTDANNNWLATPSSYSWTALSSNTTASIRLHSNTGAWTASMDFTFAIAIRKVGLTTSRTIFSADVTLETSSA